MTKATEKVIYKELIINKIIMWKEIIYSIGLVLIVISIVIAEIALFTILGFEQYLNSPVFYIILFLSCVFVGYNLISKNEDE